MLRYAVRPHVQPETSCAFSKWPYSKCMGPYSKTKVFGLALKTLFPEERLSSAKQILRFYILSAGPSLYLIYFIHLIYLIHLSIYLPIYLSIYRSFYLFILSFLSIQPFLSILSTASRDTSRNAQTPPIFVPKTCKQIARRSA